MLPSHSSIDHANMLCPRCRDLEEEGFDYLFTEKDNFNHSERPRSSFPHHATFTNLTVAASHHCLLCTLLLSAMLQCSEPKCSCAEVWATRTMPGHHALDIDESHPFEFQLEWKLPNRCLERTWICVALQYRRPGMKHPHIGPFRLRDFSSTGGYLVRLTIHSTNPENYALAYRLVPGWPDFELAKHWLATCTLCHQRCSDEATAVMPTRLIYVGDNTRDPGLVETRRRIYSYVALSHCWGDIQPLTTTRSNYDTHLEAIPFISMPRTFQDAVTACRKLAFSYIWIDSLCIIQGDSSDWEQECAIMSEIYANASVTIAGAAAGNARTGFLHKREPISGQSCDVQVRARQAPTAGVTVTLSSNENHEWQWSRGELDSPLNQRGWTMQEYVLSPRKLFFGSQQMYYMCNTMHNFEAFFYSTQPLQSSVPLNADNVWCISSNVNDWEPGTWNGLVAKYSERKLSWESDRLPALSGLASRYHKLTGDQYLAGLWRRTLAKDLLWTPDLRSKEDKRGRRDTNRFGHPLPSWSWGAYRLPIYFIEQRRDQSIQWSFVPELKILEAVADAAGYDEFGQIARACLCIRTRVWTYSLVLQPYDEVVSFDLITTEEDQPKILRFLPDQVTCGQEHDRVGRSGAILVQCALLSWRPSQIPVEASAEVWSIVVKRTADAQYRRVGLAQLLLDSSIDNLDSIDQSSKAFAGGELTDISLV